MIKKVLIICTTDSMIWHFLIPHIIALQDEGYSVECACSNTGFYMEELRDKYKLIIYEFKLSRSPLRMDNFSSLLDLKRLVKANGYDIIYCHEPVGGVIGRLVGKMCKKKVIYTAHGFHFIKGGSIKNWLLYYPAERWLARYTDVLITINKEDYVRAQAFKAKRVKYVPGVGLDFNKFSRAISDKSSKCKEVGVPASSVILLSVGELNTNKNHEIVIRAIAKLNQPSVYYLICGTGNLYNYLNELILSLGIDKQVKLLGFRTDVCEIYKIADLFVFPSRREGLSVAVMEAMATGLPVICSNIRGNNDLIENGRGGYLVPPNDIEAYINQIGRIINDNRQSRMMGLYNIHAVRRFEQSKVIKEVTDLFQEYA